MFSRSLTRLAVGARAGAATKKTIPGEDISMGGRIKSETKKMVRMQLVLIPIVLGVMIWFNPPASDDDKKKMREKYQQNAGWKS